MSDRESILHDLARDQYYEDIAKDKIRERIENLENDLYWATRAGPEAASMKRTQTAQDYWRPYQEKFGTLAAEGQSDSAARAIIWQQIQDDESWPPDYLKNRSDFDGPSPVTLRKWLK